MRPIPKKLREQLAQDPFMKRCCFPGCSEIRVEWHHVFLYAGKQINERFSIVPACVFHHRGKGFDKRTFERIALSRATQEELDRYPMRNWDQMRLALSE